MNKITVRIDRWGRVFAILPDDFAPNDLGHTRTVRLSTVEWIEVRQGWVVFDQVRGVMLRKTFKTRKEALAYERKYMDERLGQIIAWVRRSYA